MGMFLFGAIAFATFSRRDQFVTMSTVEIWCALAGILSHVKTFGSLNLLLEL